MWCPGRGHLCGACHQAGRAVGDDGVRGCECAAHGQGSGGRRPDGDCPRRDDCIDRSVGQGADSGGRHPRRRQGQVPDAGAGRDARPHSWRAGCRLGRRAHALPLRRERHHDDPRHVGRSASPDVSRARRSWRDREPAHLHIGPVVQCQDSVDERNGGRGGHRAEEGRLRPAEDTSRSAAGCVRRARGHGRRAEDPLCRPCAGGGRRHARARGQVREHRPPRRICRSADQESLCSVDSSSAPT